MLFRIIYFVIFANGYGNSTLQCVHWIAKLKEAKIQVDFVLSDEAEFLNRVFIKNMTQKLPYVVLKTASTLDGKIATSSGDSKWITSAQARAEVYRMRKEFDCILTSSNTVITDNPTMEHRFKCILDTNMRTDKNAKIFQQGNIYVATKKNTPVKNGRLDIRAVLSELYNRGVYSVFVECGGTLAGSILKEGLADEVYQFIAPKLLNDNNGLSCFNGDNVSKISDCIKLDIYEYKKIGADMLLKMRLLQK